MNEKLTSEQREWIHDEAWANFEYAEIDGQTRNVITLTQLFEILTAHTSEDEPTCYLVKCDWKTAYLELAKMVDKQLTAHTEPEDDVCPICKGGKKLYFCPTCFPEQEDK